VVKLTFRRWHIRHESYNPQSPRRKDEKWYARFNKREVPEEFKKRAMMQLRRDGHARRATRSRRYNQVGKGRIA